MFCTISTLNTSWGLEQSNSTKTGVLSFSRRDVLHCCERPDPVHTLQPLVWLLQMLRVVPLSGVTVSFCAPGKNTKHENTNIQSWIISRNFYSLLTKSQWLTVLGDEADSLASLLWLTRPVLSKHCHVSTQQHLMSTLLSPVSCFTLYYFSFCIYIYICFWNGQNRNNLSSEICHIRLDLGNFWMMRFHFSHEQQKLPTESPTLLHVCPYLDALKTKLILTRPINTLNQVIQVPTIQQPCLQHDNKQLINTKQRCNNISYIILIRVHI